MGPWEIWSTRSGGLTFTACSTVDLSTDRNFTADEIRGLTENPRQYLWGYEDGRGSPIL